MHNAPQTACMFGGRDHDCRSQVILFKPTGNQLAVSVSPGGIARNHLDGLDSKSSHQAHDPRVADGDDTSADQFPAGGLRCRPQHRHPRCDSSFVEIRRLQSAGFVGPTRHYDDISNFEDICGDENTANTANNRGRQRTARANDHGRHKQQAQSPPPKQVAGGLLTLLDGQPRWVVVRRRQPIRTFVNQSGECGLVCQINEACFWSQPIDDKCDGPSGGQCRHHQDQDRERRVGPSKDSYDDPNDSAAE